MASASHVTGASVSLMPVTTRLSTLMESATLVTLVIARLMAAAARLSTLMASTSHVTLAPARMGVTNLPLALMASASHVILAVAIVAELSLAHMASVGNVIRDSASIIAVTRWQSMTSNARSIGLEASWRKKTLKKSPSWISCNKTILLAIGRLLLVCLTWQVILRSRTRICQNFETYTNSVK